MNGRIVALSLVLFTSQGRAAEHRDQQSGHSSLVDIMKQLNGSLADLTKAMMTDSWSEVEKSAQEIAAHLPVDPKEVTRVAAILGHDMPRFEQFDQKVHEAAAEIVVAAKSRDLITASKSLGIVIQNCAGCHANFRDKVRGSAR
jgi:cytochrome c556